MCHAEQINKGYAVCGTKKIGKLPDSLPIYPYWY